MGGGRVEVQVQLVGKVLLFNTIVGAQAAEWKDTQQQDRSKYER
jgi:hypothetical protein